MHVDGAYSWLDGWADLEGVPGGFLRAVHLGCAYESGSITHIRVSSGQVDGPSKELVAEFLNDLGPWPAGVVQGWPVRGGTRRASRADHVLSLGRFSFEWMAT